MYTCYAMENLKVWDIYFWFWANFEIINFEQEASFVLIIISSFFKCLIYSYSERLLLFFKIGFWSYTFCLQLWHPFMIAPYKGLQGTAQCIQQPLPETPGHTPSLSVKCNWVLLCALHDTHGPRLCVLGPKDKLIARAWLVHGLIQMFIWMLRAGVEFHYWEGKAMFIFQRELPLKKLEVYQNFFEKTRLSGHGLHGRRVIPDL